MIRVYTWNGRDVTEAEFAQRVSDLMREGWTFQDPAAERDALLAKFEALAETWCRPNHESCLRINCGDCAANDFAAHLTAVIKEVRA